QIELARELHVADVLADEREAHTRLAGGLTGALELGLAEVDAGHLVSETAELDRVAPEAAGRVQHAGAGLEPRDAGDPLHLGRRVDRRGERMRDLRPRFTEEPLALKHLGHYSPLHDDAGHRPAASLPDRARRRAISERSGSRAAHIARRRRPEDARRVQAPAAEPAARGAGAHMTAYRLRLAAATDAQQICRIYNHGIQDRVAPPEGERRPPGERRERPRRPEPPHP